MMRIKLTAHTLVYYAFAVTMLIFTVLLSHTAFFTTANLLNVLMQTSPIVVMAIGLSFALSVGHIDLSIGAIVALCGMVAAMLLQPFGLTIAVAASLLLGGLIGAFNGYLCERLGIPSLIVTLGMLGFLTGLSRQLSGLQSIPIIDPQFISLFGQGAVLGIPSQILWLASLVCLAYIILNKLRFGRHLFAVGASKPAAYSMGLGVSRIRVWAMALSGGFAALAGLLYAGRMQSARYAIGESDLMALIAAVTLGGCSLLGGRVNIIGVLLGVWLIGCISNGLILSGFSSNEQMMVKGIILIVAVVVISKVNSK
ncbi:ABC transporter permease [Pseudoalteromonas obscura]|uniref:ABC transporter permease n=1 Tax=Pseudoalteromonas obscura TaxID=3048491 RepID=A0ABT7EKV2_9GAMM|nr:ABC transporter permease [Pseudoalteromonas sp. P94(2023)]MDK2595653.1 ABC transporter permease [Pseudoalteromonas sp. P94(2023)]